MRTFTEQQRRILDASEELFFRYGFARVTTEEIARNAGISKKTLYNVFASKSDIVSIAYIRAARDVRDTYRTLTFDDVSAYRKNISTLLETASTTLARFSMPLLEDLQTHEPRLHARFELARDRWLYGMLRDALTKGQMVGAIRPAVQPTIAAAVLARLTMAVAHPDHRPKDGYVPTLATMLRIVLDGVIRP
ncbi:MAG: TetR/AcrR family transcriptional regulator [Candidatus Kapabacteria bacterium]|nr:TetR/AcrR family transcriptional regulator [Candidatus Kapabacteria bacterium]